MVNWASDIATGGNTIQTEFPGSQIPGSDQLPGIAGRSQVFSPFTGGFDQAAAG
jgi:hypothetical protein